MRKILIAVLLVLLIVLAYFTIFQGISIGSFNILSTGKIIELNNDLDSKIEEANTKIKVSLKERRESVKQEVEKLTKSKENYYKRANTSTETQIEKANTEEIYDVDHIEIASSPSNTCSYIMNVDTDGDGRCNYNCDMNGNNILDADEMSTRSDSYRSCSDYIFFHITIPVVTGGLDNVIDDLEFFYIGRKG